MRTTLAVLALAGAALAAPAIRAQQPETAALIAGQVEAMRAFAMLDGVWRGPAATLRPDGTWRSIVQTERIGPFLGGSIRMFEGRGYEEDGRVGFNALGILSYDLRTRTYTLHSHAQGHVGDFPFTPTADGYQWQVPAGPGAVVRYTATVRDGELHEVGDRIVEGRPPVRVFDMKLRRIGDTDWPAGGAVERR